MDLLAAYRPEAATPKAGASFKALRLDAAAVRPVQAARKPAPASTRAAVPATVPAAERKGGSRAVVQGGGFGVTESGDIDRRTEAAAAVECADESTLPGVVSRVSGAWVTVTGVDFGTGTSSSDKERAGAARTRSSRHLPPPLANVQVPAGGTAGVNDSVGGQLQRSVSQLAARPGSVAGRRGTGVWSRDLPLLMNVGLALDKDERRMLEGGRRQQMVAELAAQVQVLQAAQDQMIRRLGAEPVRVAAAQHKDANADSDREPEAWEKEWADRLQKVEERVAAMDEALSGALSSILLLVQGLYSRRRRTIPASSKPVSGKHGR